jgi:hypothetical protein
VPFRTILFSLVMYLSLFGLAFFSHLAFIAPSSHFFIFSLSSFLCMSFFLSLLRDAMCLLAGTCERLQRVCGIVDVASVELAPFARSTPAASASGSAGGNSSGSTAQSSASSSSSSASTSVCRVDDVCVFVRALAAWTPVAAPIEQVCAFGIR